MATLHSLPRRLAGVALLLAGAAFPRVGGAAVYRCTGDDGAPHFSQFPCGRGDTVAVDPARTVRIPPLSDAEQQLLEELDRRHRVAETARRATRARAAAKARAQREAQRARCETARAARAALERQRRKGYRLDEARALDRQDAALEAEERENC